MNWYEHGYSMLYINTTYIYKMDSRYQVNTISWENQVKSERWSVPQAIDFTEATETPTPTVTKGLKFQKGKLLWPTCDIWKGGCGK